MVKNNAGGNKAKKFASKSLNTSNRVTRFAVEKEEIYAIVTKLMGNNYCEVLCIDGKKRLCVIRGKFLGKGKRDNILCKDKWVLIGLRSWQISHRDNNKEKCDLLEVYNDFDKEKLIKNCNEDFKIFFSINNETNEDSTLIQFSENNNEEQDNQEEIFLNNNNLHNNIYYESDNNSHSSEENDNYQNLNTEINKLNKKNKKIENNVDFIMSSLNSINIDDI